jgi:hypothetical protein
MQGGYPGGMPGQMMPGGQQQQQPRQRNGRQSRDGQGGRGAQGAGKGGQQMRQAAPPGQGQVRRTPHCVSTPTRFLSLYF